MYVADGIVLVRRLELDEKWSFAAGDQLRNKAKNRGCFFLRQNTSKTCISDNRWFIAA